MLPKAVSAGASGPRGCWRDEQLAVLLGEPHLTRERHGRFRAAGRRPRHTPHVTIDIDATDRWRQPTRDRLPYTSQLRARLSQECLCFAFRRSPMTRSNHSAVGDTLRRLRTERSLSLAGVADRAGISVATLSRVETNKQSLEVGLLLTLAGILDVSAAEIFDEDREDAESLSRRIAALPAAERAKVFFKSARPSREGALGSTLDGLVSTVEVLRDELLSVHRSLRRRRKH